MSKDIYWNNTKISPSERYERNNHKSFVLWLTGLSGSGKSTLANAIEKNCLIRTTILLCWMGII